MITVIVTIDVIPERVDGFITLATSHREHSLREPGCKRFEVSRRGNRFLLCEQFITQSALDQHRTTPHYAHWRSEIGAFEASPRKHEEFYVVDRHAQNKIVRADDISHLQRVVFTNGVFDLLGLHHIYHLQQSKLLGDVLVVGLNSDKSTRRLKGPCRPIQREDERAMMLANLAVVDFVVIFDEDTPAELVAKLRPAVITKDEAYRGQHIAGQESAGEVVFTNRMDGYSTTTLLDKINLINTTRTH